MRAFTNDGDHDALAVLLRRHETRVYGLAYRLLGNRADALDASQEVFITLFRKARSFRAEAAFTTWLHRLTVNACHDLGRKRARMPEVVEELEAVSPDQIQRSDERLAIESALAALPEDQRTAATLRDLIGLSYHEIAETTGVPVGTVKSRIARARVALARMLEDEMGSENPAEVAPEHAPKNTRLTDRE